VKTIYIDGELDPGAKTAVGFPKARAPGDYRVALVRTLRAVVVKPIPTAILRERTPAVPNINVT